MDCPTCGGNGEIECFHCSNDLPHTNEGECQDCNGTAFTSCFRCSGTGYLEQHS